MSAKTLAFLSNDNVLTVVGTYLMVIDETPFKCLAALVHTALEPYNPRDAARILDIPVQRIYEYRRDDWFERHAHKKPSSVFIRDFVKIIALGNASE